MGLLSFVHLFGVEKAALAVAFGVMALRDPGITANGRRLAKGAILAGIAYLLTLAAVFLYHMPALNSLAHKLAN
ncbi:MAG: hypothetical protein CVU79_05370 [Elusimicrobia bacterium HGW-Elusimicrobia-3]|nr:MAG: hypothetical protein CVU79_05370 [Elusimicrobia bacterium HGW-Elusimicrobia-3]